MEVTEGEVEVPDREVELTEREVEVTVRQVEAPERGGGPPLGAERWRSLRERWRSPFGDRDGGPSVRPQGLRDSLVYG